MDVVRFWRVFSGLGVDVVIVAEGCEGMGTDMDASSP